MRRRLLALAAAAGRRKSGRRKSVAAESTASIRVSSVFIAHVAASYAVMVAMAAAAFSRGVPASHLALPVLLAPVQAAIWFLFVLPLALSPWGKRVIAEPVPGVSNGIVFLGGYLVYFGVLLPVLRASYRSGIRARRRARGECVGCGYDLTGNESGVCPECGSRPQDRAC